MMQEAAQKPVEAGLGAGRPVMADGTVKPPGGSPGERRRAFYEAMGRKGPVDLDLAENTAQWCVFVGEQLSDTPWLITAAAAIRALASEVERRRPLPTIPHELRGSAVWAKRSSP